MTPALAPALAGSLMGSALLIGALVSYARWQRAGDALPLIVSSFAIGVGGLLRYDLFVVGWALALFTLVGPRVRTEEPRDERPAHAIAYAAAVTGLAGLWLLIALVTTGHVFGFVVTPVPPAPIRRIAVEALVVMAPVLVLAALAIALRRGVAPAVAAVTLAAWACVVAIVTDTWLSLDAVIPLVPLGMLLLGDLLTYAVRSVVSR